jgi:hypothetical protein
MNRLHQDTTMRRLVGAVTGLLCAQHGEVTGDDGVELVTRPIRASYVVVGHVGVRPCLAAQAKRLSVRWDFPKAFSTWGASTTAV